MSYVTRNEAAKSSRVVWATRLDAQRELRKYATAPMSNTYDIFLSHAFEDAEIIAGIKKMIETQGLSVYVDWIEDAQADRGRVTATTADMLRKRMRRCNFLLFVTTKASPASKWMPWELGYFDGFRHDHIGVLPVVETAGGSFSGQEYLGLYPAYELLDFTKLGRLFGRLTGSGIGVTLKSASAERVSVSV